MFKTFLSLINKKLYPCTLSVHAKYRIVLLQKTATFKYNKLNISEYVQMHYRLVKGDTMKI